MSLAALLGIACDGGTQAQVGQSGSSAIGGASNGSSGTGTLPAAGGTPTAGSSAGGTDSGSGAGRAGTTSATGGASAGAPQSTAGTASGGGPEEGGAGGTSNSGGGGGLNAGGSAGAGEGGNGVGGQMGGGVTTTRFVFTVSTNGWIRAYQVSDTDGSLTAAGSLNTNGYLDFLALGPDGRTLFASRDKGVSSYSYDPKLQEIAALFDQSTTGGGTHVAVDPTGGFVFVAHYNEGAMSFLPYSADSGFGAAQRFTPGMNTHQITVSPSGTDIYATSLGNNLVAHYTLAAATGTLSEAMPANVPVDGGPRHMALHPTAPVAYVLTEKSSQVHVLDIDASSGAMTLRTGASLFMEDDEMYHWSSDIHVTPDGNFVYAINRDPTEIVTFEVQADNSLVRLGATALGGVVRSFGMDTRGDYLFIGADDGTLVTYGIDVGSGDLAKMGSETGLGNVHATFVSELTLD